ncbi:MAG: alpha-2-macroglobulin family protein, partial [Bryobacteraceae bacterium]
HQGNKRVKVPPVEQQLHVELTTVKPQYQPGETATYNLDVKDSNGRAVAGAEFSLGVVDEAIYAIRKDTTPDILQFFYGRQYNNVATDSSLSYYFRGEAGKRRMQLASLPLRTPLAQLKPERLVQPKIRKAFPDTAYWNPGIVTNAQGYAQAQFAFPDSLTAWRATARGITANTRVGSAIQKTIVRKNIIVRLAVPRFFTQGDEVTISAIVHNYLPDGKKARVSLDVKGLDIVGGVPSDVDVPARGDVKVDWRVRAQNVSEAVLTGKALTNQESDALELTIPIHPEGVKQTQARGGSLAGSITQASAVFDFPAAQVAPSSRSIDISGSPSIAGALFGALDYLTSFPYGCTEQTMSSFLPDVVVSQALKELKIQSRIDPAELQAKIAAGQERLYDFQHPDGGWGWWKTDESGYFMTSYVVSGLSQARDAGVHVQEDRVGRGEAWLTQAITKDPSIAADAQAYAAYALTLANSRHADIVDRVWRKKSDLSPYGLALIGLAFDWMKDSRAKEVAAELIAKAKQNETEAWWQQDQDPLLDIYADATPETTAYALKLLAHTDPQSPLLPKAALWLMDHRNQGFYWYSTKQTAMVIYGLTDYLKLSNELTPNFTATIYVNDKQVAMKSFSPADALSMSSLSLHLGEGQVSATQNRVRVEMKGSGRLYWSARASYYSMEPKLTKTGKVALNILRDYFKLMPRNTGSEIVYDLNPLTGPLAPGDIVAVRLTVTGGNWRYLMMEDPIPAGTEFIERDDLYKLSEKPSWWFYSFTRREMHDDRLAIFQTYFARGQQQYFYLLKVVNPGVFHVNPASVQPMYQPEFLSTSESRQIEVKP